MTEAAIRSIKGDVLRMATNERPRSSLEDGLWSHKRRCRCAWKLVAQLQLLHLICKLHNAIE